MQMVTLIGGNARIIRRKDMEHKSGLAERDTLGSTCRVSNMGMVFSDSQMELYIKDNSNKIILKVMHISGRQMAKSIMDSIKMIRSTEREYSNKAA